MSRKKSRHEFRANTLPAMLTVGPVTLIMILLIAVPLLYVAVMSVCSLDEYYNVTFKFTLSNYTRLLNADYLKIYIQSIVIALVTTVLCILIGYPFAYFIARTKSKKKKILYMLVIIPFWTNSLIRIYGWRSFLGTSGWINFSPMFFASIGLQVVLPKMSAQIVIFAVVLTVVAILTKIVGCGAGALACGYEMKHSVRIGVGMISRGEVALIVADKGLKVNLISDDLMGPVVIVVIVTTIITPLLLKFVYRSKPLEPQDVQESMYQKLETINDERYDK